jgi:hypothetical protein
MSVLHQRERGSSCVDNKQKQKKARFEKRSEEGSKKLTFRPFRFSLETADGDHTEEEEKRAYETTKDGELRGGSKGLGEDLKCREGQQEQQKRQERRRLSSWQMSYQNRERKKIKEEKRTRVNQTRFLFPVFTLISTKSQK